MISEKITENLKRASFIRAMFEEGLKLKKIYGPANVYDFTLGNPDPEPPENVLATARRLLGCGNPGLHMYMSNAGFPDVRANIASHINKASGATLMPEHIVMSCGAAGGLNVVLKALLDPGDEVIVISPFFFEYAFYIDNHGGKCIICPAVKGSFQPDAEAIGKAVGDRTKAIIINSPNNPTGVVYTEEILQKLNMVITEKEKEFGKEIYVISDEPYNKIVYDNVEVPAVINIFRHSIIVNSFSKSLSLPGERIGYIAVNPAVENVDILINALVFCTRTLGYVNAPSLFQKVVSENLDSTVDIKLYSDRRDMLYEIITGCGFRCNKPAGAFYLFPESPLADDIAFKDAALKYNILLVPGTGFSCPGYFRLAYCVNPDMIRNSRNAFKKLAADFGLS